MQYPVSPGGCAATTMVDLLSSNLRGVQAFLEQGRRPERLKDLCQAFGTAETAFEAIPDETVPVLVPYGGGKGQAAPASVRGGTPSLLRELQPYTVSLSPSQCQRLGPRSIRSWTGAALALREP